MEKKRCSGNYQLGLNGNYKPTLTTLSLLPGLLDVDRTKIDSLDRREAEEKSPLTIFYNGKVVVFDDFTEKAAKDLIQLATDGSSAAAFPVADRRPKNCLPPAPAGLNRPDLLAQKRSASLQRFLHKRKERINAKAPYCLNGSFEKENVAKPEETQSWLGLGQGIWN